MSGPRSRSLLYGVPSCSTPSCSFCSGSSIAPRSVKSWNSRPPEGGLINTGAAPCRLTEAFFPVRYYGPLRSPRESLLIPIPNSRRNGGAKSAVRMKQRCRTSSHPLLLHEHYYWGRGSAAVDTSEVHQYMVGNTQV